MTVERRAYNKKGCGERGVCHKRRVVYLLLRVNHNMSYGMMSMRSYGRRGIHTIDSPVVRCQQCAVYP